MSQKLPSVSIVFPVYNGGNQPLECIKSITKLNYPKNELETIVVDNNSSDGSGKRIRDKYKFVKIIINSTNVGFASAVNQAIKQSKGKYVFIANDDLVFEKNSLKHLILYMLSNPQIGITSGKIFLKSNPKKLSSAGYTMNKWTGNVKSDPKPNIIKEPAWLQGCALLTTKKILKSVGFLDSEYKHFFEDFDLCLKIRRAGLKVVYLPKAVFWHGESISADKNKSFKYYHWYRSKIRFLIKNMPFINVLSILLLQIFLITPHRAIVLRDGRFFFFLKAFFWNLKNLNKTLKTRNI